MLKGISPLISPQLLKVLCEMGHGDEIVLSDAHFPAGKLGPEVLRADGIPVSDLLGAILPLFELDSYTEKPVIMMAPVEGDSLDETLMAKIRGLCGEELIDHIDRFDFYERAGRAYAIVVSGETLKYGNIILKKGVIPVS